MRGRLGERAGLGFGLLGMAWLAQFGDSRARGIAEAVVAVVVVIPSSARRMGGGEYGSVQVGGGRRGESKGCAYWDRVSTLTVGVDGCDWGALRVLWVWRQRRAMRRWGRS